MGINYDENFLQSIPSLVGLVAGTFARNQMLHQQQHFHSCQTLKSKDGATLLQWGKKFQLERSSIQAGIQERA